MQPTSRRKLFRTLTGLLTAVVCLILSNACFKLSDYHRPGCNVILISIDTLRVDRLGCYGYTRDTSPNIDRFREDAVLFQCNISQAPSTMASHASIFTSLVPSHHGAYFSLPNPLADNWTTMAEFLQNAGYHTVSFNDGGQISAELGFDQGFDRYVCLPNKERKVYKFINTVNATFRWFRQNRKQPFFLFLHTYHTHHPYTPDQRFIEELGVTLSGALPRKISIGLLREINRGQRQLSPEAEVQINALYDAEIREMDHTFGQLVKRLKRNNIYDNSLIIFTSDHGEEMGEHSLWGCHSHSLFEEVLRVPLIIKFPGSDFAGTEVRQQVRSLDILPTILEVVGIPPPILLEGRTLMPPVHGWADEPRPALAQLDSVRVPMALRADGWKYYPARGTYDGALYRIDEDPREERNQLYCEPQTGRELDQQLKDLLAQQPEALAQNTIELSQPVTEQLKELGYLDD